MKVRFASGDLLASSFLHQGPFLSFPLQYGFNLVMSHPHAVNEIALSLNNKNPRCVDSLLIMSRFLKILIYL